MKTSEIDDVLILLALVILADNKVYRQEVEVFIKVAESLGDDFWGQNIISRKFLHDWLKLHFKELETLNKSKSKDAALAKLFIRLKQVPQKRKLVDAMVSVAAADGKIQVDEKILISLAALYWDQE